MDYLDYNDSELLYYISENNEDAEKIIVQKYKPIIRSMAYKTLKKYKYMGIDINDLYQEGLVILNNAIYSFDETRNVKFSTFLTKCIQTKFMNVVRTLNNGKNNFHNMTVPLDFKDDENYKIDILLRDDRANPEDIILADDQAKHILDDVKNKLSSFEADVLDLKICGFTYPEISKLLNKNIKNIDNAMQRIRIKTRKVLSERK